MSFIVTEEGEPLVTSEPGALRLARYQESNALISPTRFGRITEIVSTFRPEWTGAVEDNGARSASFSGMVTQEQEQYLVELLSNEDEKTLVRGYYGVIGYLDLDAAGVSSFRGWYVFTSTSYRPMKPGNRAIPFVPLSIEGIHFGDAWSVEPRLIWSGRPRKAAVGLLPTPVLVDPIGQDFVVPPSGQRITRLYDPTTPYNPTRDMAPASELALYLVPPEPQRCVPAFDPKAWVRSRGMDVVVYDRRRHREVGGSGHSFDQTTDCVLSNGIIELWVGGRGIAPYVVMSAFDGTWREVGTIMLSADVFKDELVNARLERVSNDLVTLALVARNIGNVYLTLRRGRPYVEISYEQRRLMDRREISLVGTPPQVEAADGSVAPALFGNGLDGFIRMWWPPDVSQERWAVSGVWLPSDSNAVQPDSGLGEIRDDANVSVGFVKYLAATDQLQFSLGGVTLETPAIVFDADDSIFWVARFSEERGMSFTVVNGGTVHHLHDDSTNPGTTGKYKVLQTGIGWGGAWWGLGEWGDGVWGGPAAAVLPPNGLSDNWMIFEDDLTDTEAAFMGEASSPLENLPYPIARLRWHARFDAPPNPAPGAMDNRKLIETVPTYGFQRMMAGAEEVVPGPGFSLRCPDTQWSAIVAVARGFAENGAVGLHSQFLFDDEQRLGLL